MTATEWALAALAVLAGAAACALARVLGNFWMALKRLDAPMYCPEFFLSAAGASKGGDTAADDADGRPWRPQLIGKPLTRKDEVARRRDAW